MRKTQYAARGIPRFLVLGALLITLLAVSVFVGRYPAPFWMAPSLLREDPLALQLVLNLRLPRILAACLLGMALSASGAVLQMIFRNPLVEPGFLGVSQGAAFGAAFSIIVLGGSPLVIQGSAAFFACLGLAFSSFLARRIRYGGWTLRLVLAGIAVSAMFSAGLGLFKYIADPLTQLPELVFWMLGALWGITWSDVLTILPVTVVALVIITLMRWRLNLLSLDDETAFSLGTAPARERMVLLVAAVASTAAVVSVAGIVGWVGLIVPHLARRLLGADAQHALPGSMLIGGTFAVLCDDVARTALSGEIPLGILTSLIGAFVFVVLMVSKNPVGNA
jgi:iron complex transport system permease protein